MPTVDMTPSTGLVQAWRHQLPWLTVCSELIDNGYDAGATRVLVCVDANRLRVIDNGAGCPDLRTMLKPGQHTRQATTRLGRYGVGFKYATVSAGDVVEIVSVHGGKRSYTRINWAYLERSNTWSADIEEGMPTDEPAGTTITVTHLRRKTDLGKHQIAKLIEQLQEQYTPAIKQGRQLIVEVKGKTHLLQAAELPELEHMRAMDFQINHKQARLRIGLMPEGATYANQGMTVSYGFRVIHQRVKWGLGTEPLPGLVATLELLEGWDLSTNKERVLDEDIETLAKQIAERCADIIALAAKRGYSVPLQDVSTTLTEMYQRVQSSQKTGKEKRVAPTNHTGTVTPKYTGRKRSRATLVQDGDRFPLPVKEAHGIKISLPHLGEEAELYNYESPGIINLNIDNPVIYARRHDTGFLTATAIHALAVHMICEPTAQLELGFPQVEGSTRAAQLSAYTALMMRHLPRMEGET